MPRPKASIFRLQRGLKKLLQMTRREARFDCTFQLHFCRQADREHKKSWRQFAHSLHYPNVICFAHAAAGELIDDEILGILAHEIGHIVANIYGMPWHAEVRGKSIKKGSRIHKELEREANYAAKLFLNVSVHYNGRTLEEIVKR